MMKKELGGIKGPDGGRTKVVEQGGSKILSGVSVKDPFRKKECRWGDQRAWWITPNMIVWNPTLCTKFHASIVQTMTDRNPMLGKVVDLCMPANLNMGQGSPGATTAVLW